MDCFAAEAKGLDVHCAAAVLVVASNYRDLPPSLRRKSVEKWKGERVLLWYHYAI